MALMNPEGDNPKQLPLTAIGYLHSGSVSEDIHRMQAMEENDGHPSDIESVFARKIMRVGREYLMALLARYPYGTSPLTGEITPEDKLHVTQSVAAIALGACCLSLKGFLQTEKEEFDTGTHVSLFENAVIGMGITLERPTNSREIIQKATRTEFAAVVNIHGIAGLFDPWRWDKLPESIQEFVHKLGIKDSLHVVAHDFKEKYREMKNADRLLGRLEEQPKGQYDRRTPPTDEEVKSLSALFGDFDPFRNF